MTREQFDKIEKGLGVLIGRVETIEVKLDLIIKQQENIMSNQTSISQQLATVQASLTSIATGVTALDAKIQALQAQIAASNSLLTPSDQAALDALVTQSASLAQAASTIPGTP